MNWWGFCLAKQILPIRYAASFSDFQTPDSVITQYYSTTALTKIFHAIITTPYPYWSVILLSGIGTFLYIRFGDELMDVLHHRDRTFFNQHGYKHELIIMAAVFLIIVIGYYELITSLGIDGVM